MSLLKHDFPLLGCFINSFNLCLLHHKYQIDCKEFHFAVKFPKFPVLFLPSYLRFPCFKVLTFITLPNFIVFRWLIQPYLIFLFLHLVFEIPKYLRHPSIYFLTIVFSLPKFNDLTVARAPFPPKPKFSNLFNQFYIN